MSLQGPASFRPLTAEGMQEDPIRVFAALRLWMVLLLAALGCAPHAFAQGPRLLDNTPIRMRDGVDLIGSVYLPDASGKTWPVVIAPTPYGRTSGHNKAMQFARSGFVFILLDVRGRGDSGGHFTPWVNEAADMYDAVEWAAAQPFSTGAVGLWGSSYGGFLQWAAASQRPPHLKAIQPAASGLPGFDFPMSRNMMSPYAATWAGYVSGRSAKTGFFGDLAFQAQTYEQMYRTGRPLKDLDGLIGFPSPVFQEWLKHPTIDSYWTSMWPTDAEMAAIDIPILTITGYWDSAQSSSLEYYRWHARAAPDAARRNHFVVIGPFDHGGTRFPTPQVGGLQIDPAGVIDMHALDLAWFGWTLRGDPKPSFLKGNIAYYPLGGQGWRYRDRLEDVPVSGRTLWLDPAGRPATSLADSGRLAPAAPAKAASLAFISDPADFSKIGPGGWFSGPWVIDQADIARIEGDGLVFESKAFESPIILSGQPRVDLSVAIDTPDADLRVRLYAIQPDGSSVYLGRDRMRARYREGLREPRAVPPRTFLPYSFDQLPFISRRIAAGERLRLVVDTPRSAHDPRNFNTGGPIAEETLHNARRARIEVRVGGASGSRIWLPIDQDGEAERAP